MIRPQPLLETSPSTLPGKEHIERQGDGFRARQLLAFETRRAAAIWQPLHFTEGIALLDHMCDGGIWVGVIPLAGCSIISGKPHMMPERMPGEGNSVLQRFSERKSQ